MQTSYQEYSTLGKSRPLVLNSPSTNDVRNTYLQPNRTSEVNQADRIVGENYNLIHASLGCENGRLVTEEDIPESNPEFDTYWRLKTRENDGRIGSTLRA